MWWVLLVLGAVFGGVIALGSARIQANYFLNSIHSGTGKGLALSFDDGPDPLLTPKLLDVLDQHGAKASFFLIGHMAEAHPEVVQQIVAKGHTIGNHSFSHEKNLTWMSSSALDADIARCSAVLQNITGKAVAWFRPPFGVTTPRYARVLRQQKLQSIGWSLRSLDTTMTRKEEVLKRVLPQLAHGRIVLFHDTCAHTIEALPEIFAHCSQKGIDIVSIDAMTQHSPYH